MLTVKDIKMQDTPKKRITTAAKAYAKQRVGIQASERDITNRDVFDALFDYLAQLEEVITLTQKGLKNHLEEKHENE